MRHAMLAVALAGTAGVFTVPAAAVTCYQLIDRNENIVYQDVYPPVDLSDQGASQRETLRRRGEHLISMELDRCPTIEFFTGAGGSVNLDFDRVSDSAPGRSLRAAAGTPGARPTQGKRGAATPPESAKVPAPAKSTAKPGALQN